MIEPQYLADLRRKHRAELLLVMVQLDQLCPGWWPSLTALAEQMGADRKAVNVSLQKLGGLGLIGRYSVPGVGGTWLWWVKKSAAEKPPPVPGWQVRDLQTQGLHTIRVGEQQEWAMEQGIPFHSLRGFLGGDRIVLHKRWRLVRTPFDLVTADHRPLRLVA